MSKDEFDSTIIHIDDFSFGDVLNKTGTHCLVMNDDVGGFVTVATFLSEAHANKFMAKMEQILDCEDIGAMQ